jgi:N-dimethylarginine dimethylaminohydrolase
MRRVLLCPPDYYGIEYEINPWMDRARRADRDVALKQWQRLRDGLQLLGCEIELVDPQPGLPDMVFTANAGVVIGTRFISSRFRHAERQNETPLYEQWFIRRDYEIVRLPDKLLFEGEGDALFSGDVLFCGYRFRSDIRSHRWLGDVLKSLVISVELVDARFYHLDTCFCPLGADRAMWFPGAFDDYGQRAIREHIRELIDVSPDEALRFACNAVVLDRDILMPDGCTKLGSALTDRGYRCHGLAMSEFMKAGGACKCLTLFLPQRPA